MPEAVILEAVRTPFGRRGGALREARPDTLLAHTLKGLVERAGIDPEKIEDVIDGTVTLAGEQAANPGRLAVLLAGFPVKIHQGESAERVAEQWGLTRKMLDDFATDSHRKAYRAQHENLNQEILPVDGVSPEAHTITVYRDEGVRGVIDEQKMASLKPAFRPAGQGVITAANSSQISDGASAVLVANADVAKADGFRPKARFRARVVVGSDPTLQLTGVIPAAQMALRKARLSIDDIDWIEINEAFASVVLSWARELNADLAKVNPWGGAIAHGHPLGATGGGLMAKMIAGLEATEGQFGLQVMCIGHGQATATIVERT